MTGTPDLLNEDDVRALLNGTPAPQVGVDLEAAIRTGRRMSVRRRAAGVTSGVAAVALVAALVVVVSKADTPRKQVTAPAAVPSQSSASVPLSGVTAIKLRCPMTPLAKPAGAAGLQIDAVDPSGRYVSAHAVRTTENFTSVLWVDGVPEYLRFADSVQISAINSRGVAVGSASIDATSTIWNFRYANGVQTALQVPAGWRAYGNVTINENGDIADTIQPADQPESASQGIVWKAGSTSPTIVPLPPKGQVVAITADTRLLGSVADGRLGEVYLWDLAGNGTTLTRPDGFPAAPEATAGIYATGKTGGRIILRWDITTNRFTQITSVSDGVGPPSGRHISATGWITDGLQVAYRPDGTPVRMTAPGPNEVMSAGVTDNGDVFGTYYTRNALESYTPVIWHCGSAG